MSKAKIVLAALVWLILLSIGVSIYRLWFVPTVAQREEQRQEEAEDRTSGTSKYSLEFNLGLDAFSGYAVLRSDEMLKELGKRGIKMELVDDGANYEARLAALASGDLQLAAFPIDALLKTARKMGKLPATIVAIIDETQGADAIVAYKDKFPNIESLNSPETRFVLVSDSPSETLTRLVLHTFNLSALSSDSIASVQSEQELVERFKRAKPGGNDVFVTWEPVVSQLVRDGQLMHKLYDSSKQSGVIVDALVVSRYFLLNNEPAVRDILASYFNARHTFGSDRSKLIELVEQDAAKAGAPLSAKQATSLVEGIVWKNTQENLAHFGLRSASLPHVEDMIDRIQRVLTDTGGLSRDPTEGDATALFYEKVLSSLQTSGFYPGASDETLNEEISLQNLNEQQWKQLQPVGTVDLPPLIYARGTARLTESSKLKLQGLMDTLKTFPRYYVMIRGNASSRGDEQANKMLAKQRADAALQYLLDHGVEAAKLRAVEGEISGQTSVTFVLAEMPY